MTKAIHPKFYQQYYQTSIAQKQLVHTFKASIQMDLVMNIPTEELIFLIDNSPIKCKEAAKIKICLANDIYNKKQLVAIENAWINGKKQILNHHHLTYKFKPKQIGWNSYNVKLQAKYPYQEAKTVERRIYYYVEK